MASLKHTLLLFVLCCTVEYGLSQQSVTGYRDICEVGTKCQDNICKNDGTCVNMNGGAYCCCKENFTGIHCERPVNSRQILLQHIDRDSSSNPTHYVPSISPSVAGKKPCLDNEYGPDCRQYCKPTDSCDEGHYTCDRKTGEKICMPGWNGTDCDDRLFLTEDTFNLTCPESKCRNGGQCHRDKCCCVFGFTGVLCQIEIIECKADSCANGGQCIDLIGSFNCSCLPGFTGKTCTEVDPDYRNTTNVLPKCHCENGATCVGDSAFVTCLCPTGFTGSRCETSLLSSSTPGTAVCPVDYYGPDCKQHCLSQDSCEFGHYVCDQVSGRKVCLQGWTGTGCVTRSLSKDQDPECPQNVGCKNDGQCFNGTCCCRSRFSGQYCEIASIGCHSNPCQHGGTCVEVPDTQTDYTCRCLPGYTGLDCEFVRANSQTSTSLATSGPEPVYVTSTLPVTASTQHQHLSEIPNTTTEGTASTSTPSAFPITSVSNSYSSTVATSSALNSVTFTQAHSPSSTKTINTDLPITSTTASRPPFIGSLETSSVTPDIDTQTTPQINELTSQKYQSSTSTRRTPTEYSTETKTGSVLTSGMVSTSSTQKPSPPTDAFQTGVSTQSTATSTGSTTQAEEVTSSPNAHTYSQYSTTQSGTSVKPTSTTTDRTTSATLGSTTQTETVISTSTARTYSQFSAGRSGTSVIPTSATAEQTSLATPSDSPSQSLSATASTSTTQTSATQLSISGEPQTSDPAISQVSLHTTATELTSKTEPTGQSSSTAKWNKSTQGPEPQTAIASSPQTTITSPMTSEVPSQPAVTPKTPTLTSASITESTSHIPKTTTKQTRPVTTTSTSTTSIPSIPHQTHKIFMDGKVPNSSNITEELQRLIKRTLRNTTKESCDIIIDEFKDLVNSKGRHITQVRFETSNCSSNSWQDKLVLSRLQSAINTSHILGQYGSLNVANTENWFDVSQAYSLLLEGYLYGDVVMAMKTTILNVWNTRKPDLTNLDILIVAREYFLGRYGSQLTKITYFASSDGNIIKPSRTPAPGIQYITEAIYTNAHLPKIARGPAWAFTDSVSVCWWNGSSESLLADFVQQNLSRGLGCVDGCKPSILSDKPMPALASTGEEVYCQDVMPLVNGSTAKSLSLMSDIPQLAGLIYTGPVSKATYIDVHGIEKYRDLLQMYDNITSIMAINPDYKGCEDYLDRLSISSKIARCWYMPKYGNNFVSSAWVNPNSYGYFKALRKAIPSVTTIQVSKRYSLYVKGDKSTTAKEDVIRAVLKKSWEMTNSIVARGMIAIKNAQFDTDYVDSEGLPATRIDYLVFVDGMDSSNVNVEEPDTVSLLDKFSQSGMEIYSDKHLVRKLRQVFVIQNGVVIDETALETAVSEAWNETNFDFAGSLDCVTVSFQENFQSVDGRTAARYRYYVSIETDSFLTNEEVLYEPSLDTLDEKIKTVNGSLQVIQVARQRQVQHPVEKQSKWWIIVVAVGAGCVLAIIVISVVVSYIRYIRKRESRTLKQRPEEIEEFDKEHFSTQPEFDNPAFSVNEPDFEDDSVKSDIYVVNDM